MSVSNGAHPAHPGAAPPAPAQPQTNGEPHQQVPSPDTVPRTRAAAAWVGICVSALGFVVLVVFMLQNTTSTEVNFLWMQGSLPLAVALLIAAVGAALVATTVGAARIAQLRRLIRRRR